MPWFFFKAGMFHSSRSLKEVALQSVFRLLVPYVFFLIIGVAECVFIGGNVDISKLYFYGSMDVNNALWFLPTLFMVRIISCVVDLSNSLLACFCILILFPPLCILAPSGFEYRVVCGLLAGLCFYIAGKLYSGLRDKHKEILHFFSIAMGALIAFFDHKIIGMYNMKCSNWYDIPIWFTFCLAIILITISIVRMSHVSETKFGKLISYVGRTSMRYYVTHMLIICLYIYVYITV